MSSMSVFAVAEAGELLAWARRKKKRIKGLPEQARPRDLDDAYAVQTDMARRLALPIGGWKVGCTSVEAQKLLRVDRPFAGPLFAPHIHPAPATLPGADFHRRGLEPEFAFMMGGDLPPRGRDYERDEVVAAVASLHPAIEIVDSRFESGFAMAAPDLVADGAVNGAFVYGPAVAGWADRDLAACPVELWANDRLVKQGIGANALGHPLNVMVWLANLLAGPLADATGGLQAGQIVTTGTCAGIWDAGPHDRAVAQFGPCGAAEVAFA